VQLHNRADGAGAEAVIWLPYHAGPAGRVGCGLKRADT
jgi:hypothetical protein